MPRRAWVLSLFFLVGCGGERNEFLTVFDPCRPLVLASAIESPSIGDAIDMWNAVSNTGLTVESSTTADVLPIEFEDTELYLGRYDDEAVMIRLASRVEQRRVLAIVLAHELGHAFGLKHVSGRRSVMNKGNTTIEPLEADGAALKCN